VEFKVRPSDLDISVYEILRANVKVPHP